METAIMSIVTLGLSSLEEAETRLSRAFAGETLDAQIGFASPELLWSVLTAKRWDVLKAMTGAGPLAIREVARRVKRDVKAVHGDVTALIKAGLLDRSEEGVLFPYDAVRVSFTLTRAA
jgi:predicted transcriptional regulator